MFYFELLAPWFPAVFTLPVWLPDFDRSGIIILFPKTRHSNLNPLRISKFPRERERYSWNVRIYFVIIARRRRIKGETEKHRDTLNTYSPLSTHRNFPRNFIFSSWPYSLVTRPSLFFVTPDKFGILIIANCHGFEDSENEGDRGRDGLVDRAYNA